MPKIMQFSVWAAESNPDVPDFKIMYPSLMLPPGPLIGVTRIDGSIIGEIVSITEGRFELEMCEIT